MTAEDFSQLIRTTNLFQVIEQYRRWEKTELEGQQRLTILEDFFVRASKLPRHPPHASRPPSRPSDR